MFPTQTYEITREIEGHTDPNTGQWVEGGETLIATLEADIQPKSGRQRANELQTEYESDYIAFADEIVYETGFSEIKQGDVIDGFTIVFVADWTEHLELELKAND